MFGTVCHPTLSTFVRLDLLKERLNSPIFHHFLNVLTLNLIYTFTVCMFVGWYVLFVCVCVCVCMFVCMGSSK